MGFEDAYIQWQVKVSHVFKTLNIIWTQKKECTERRVGTKGMVPKAMQVVWVSSRVEGEWVIEDLCSRREGESLSTKYYLPECTKTSIGMGRDGFKLQSLQEGVAARREGVTGVRGMLYFALNNSVVRRQVIWSCATTNWRSTQWVSLIRRNL